MHAALIDDALVLVHAAPGPDGEERRRLVRRLTAVRDGACADPACHTRCQVCRDRP